MNEQAQLRERLVYETNVRRALNDLADELQHKPSTDDPVHLIDVAVATIKKLKADRLQLALEMNKHKPAIKFDRDAWPLADKIAAAHYLPVEFGGEP